MYPREFDYVAPGTLDEALAALASNPGAKIMSGGMSLIPMMKLRLLSPATVIDIGRIPGLDAIEDRGDHLAIGALVRHAQTASSELVSTYAAALAQAAALTGDVQVRNRGTTVGAVAHADLAADTTAAALALGATMVARSSAGSREIPASEFFVDTLTSALAEDEILVELRIPKSGSGESSAYTKLGRRGGESDYAVAGAAVWVRKTNGSVSDARVALTGVGSKAVLSSGAMDAIIGSDGSESAIAAAASRAGEGINMLEDLYGSEEYKAHLASVYVRRALAAALS
jgi:aerobic carbon-monoxide dehydrogenase medium subunit